MDHRFSKTDRDYIIGLRGEYLQGIRISKKFLDLIDAPEELKAKFEMFKSKYKKYPQFGYNSVLRDRSVNTHIYFQKTINRINVENFFTEEDIETLIDCWVNTYTEAYDWLTARGVVDKTVENVCDFVSDHYLGIGCAVFGVAALAGIIPAIAKKYKSEADIRDAVNYYMGSVDWDSNDESKSVPRSFVAWDAKGNPTVRVYYSTLEGNKDTAEEIFKAVAKAAKKNGTTVRQEFHNLDGKKVKGLGGKETDEDAFRFDILEDKDGVLTIKVWGQVGRKEPKTFEIDTNTYQRIGDVQYSWNESRKRSGRIKENKKPYTPCEISAWEAKNYIQRQNLTCENEQGTLRIFYGPLEVGCMVFTPASYYLAGLDETVYWEGTTMNQFRVDFEEFKATLREADVEFTETGWINPYKG